MFNFSRNFGRLSWSYPDLSKAADSKKPLVIHSDGLICMAKKNRGSSSIHATIILVVDRKRGINAHFQNKLKKSNNALIDESEAVHDFF